MSNDRSDRLKNTVKDELKDTIKDELKNVIKESLLRISGFISTYFAVLKIGPHVWLPASIATTSLIILWRMGGLRKNIPQERFLEEVEKDIILLNYEIKEHENVKQNLEKAWEKASEDVKQRIEDELKAEDDRLKILRERIAYLEVLLSSIKTIEVLRHKYGAQINQVYGKIIDLAIKIEKGAIKSENIDKELEKLMNMREKSPDFPYMVREIIEGMLSQR
jgi:septal ring factor EnvC (AmiA/AmiB activator)